MSGAEVLSYAVTFSLVVLTGAVILAIVRLIRGPTLADRILSLDLITTLLVAYIASIAIRTDFDLYIDIAVSIGLMGFLSTVAFARYLLKQAQSREERGTKEAIE
jgi:multicomponent Na+:H+ antiporter subunit F